MDVAGNPSETLVTIDSAAIRAAKRNRGHVPPTPAPSQAAPKAGRVLVRTTGAPRAPCLTEFKATADLIRAARQEARRTRPADSFRDDDDEYRLQDRERVLRYIEAKRAGFRLDEHPLFELFVAAPHASYKPARVALPTCYVDIDGKRTRLTNQQRVGLPPERRRDTYCVDDAGKPYKLSPRQRNDLEMSRRREAADRAIKAGRTKDYLQPMHKWAAMQCEYVDFGSDFYKLIRIELDKIWRVDDLLADLDALVAAGKIPSRPHAIVGAEIADGVIHHPHLYWCLPPSAYVLRVSRKGKKVSQAAIQLYKAVLRGATRALVCLGADIGGLAHNQHGKWALCKTWTTVVANESIFPDLTAWRECVGGSIDLEEVARGQAVAAGGSNHDFEALHTRPFAHLAEQLSRRRHIPAVDSIAYWLECALRKQALADLSDGTHKRDKQVLAVLRCCCRWSALRWCADAAPKDTKNRGACRADCRGKAKAARQAIGGRYGGAENARKSLEAIALVMDGMLRAGLRVTEDDSAEIAQAAKLHIKTVKLRFSRALEAAQAIWKNSVDKKDTGEQPASLTRAETRQDLKPSGRPTSAMITQTNRKWVEARQRPKPSLLSSPADTQSGPVFDLDTYRVRPDRLRMNSLALERYRARNQSCAA